MFKHALAHFRAVQDCNVLAHKVSHQEALVLGLDIEARARMLMALSTGATLSDTRHKACFLLETFEDIKDNSQLKREFSLSIARDLSDLGSIETQDGGILVDITGEDTEFRQWGHEQTNSEIEVGDLIAAQRKDLIKLGLYLNSARSDAVKNAMATLNELLHCSVT